MIGMTIPQETLKKMEALTSEKMSILIQFVDQISMSPQDMFEDLRSEGQKKNLSEEEIDDFVDSVKSEHYVVSG